jgi:hypothetical protein
VGLREVCDPRSVLLTEPRCYTSHSILFIAVNPSIKTVELLSDIASVGNNTPWLTSREGTSTGVSSVPASLARHGTNIQVCQPCSINDRGPATAADTLSCRTDTGVWERRGPKSHPRKLHHDARYAIGTLLQASPKPNWRRKLHRRPSAHTFPGQGSNGTFQMTTSTGSDFNVPSRI